MTNVRHIQTESTLSTQNDLKELILSGDNTVSESFSKILISTHSQTQGHGRKDRKWTQPANSLCFSFTLPVRENLSLSALEISLHLLNYLNETYNFQGTLKWPNDILDKKNKKCAGILIDLLKNKLLVGIGINIGSIPNKNFIGASVLQDKVLQKNEYHSIPLDIYKAIYSRFPMQEELLRSSWQNSCAHMNTTVSISERESVLEGLFIGIGKNGEALLKENEAIKKVFNGSLHFL